MTDLLTRYRVRLWFGQHQIADYIGDAAHADRYEAAMRRRFPGLEVSRVTLVARGPHGSGHQGVLETYLSS